MITELNSQLEYYATKEDLDAKVNKSDVVTKEEDVSETNTNPIATNLVIQTFREIFDSIDTSLKVARFFTEIGADTNNLTLINNNDDNIGRIQEVYSVLYGRENNVDDTLADGNGANSLLINDIRRSSKSLLYIRKRGTYFYTYGHIILCSEFIFGTVTRCDGQGTGTVTTIEPSHNSQINTIKLISNNLIKSDSKLGVWFR